MLGLKLVQMIKIRTGCGRHFVDVAGVVSLACVDGDLCIATDVEFVEE